MSHEAVSWAHNLAPMLLTEAGKPDITARQILVALAERASADGSNAYPSVLRLHFMTGVDVKTIPRVLARLERGGLIEHVSTKPTGNKNWSLDLSAVRPATEWDDLVAAVEKAKRIESEKRQERRARGVSGTQDAGQTVEPETVSGVEGPDVRHLNHRRPAFKVPESGTQSVDVRHSKRTEPSLPVLEPSTGGAPPPDPRREPTPSGRVIESDTSITKVVTDQPSLAAQPTTRGHAENVVDFTARRNRIPRSGTAS